MGNLIASLFTTTFTNGGRDLRLVILGLDGSGKTTMLMRLKLGEVVSTTPTIGFNVETIRHNNLTMTMWDIGGQDKIRCLWRHYYQNTRGVIFVVDSNDRERVQEAKQEIQMLVREDELRDALLLVLANKQDLPNAMSPSELTNTLGLHDVTHMKWAIRGTCAQKGEGLYESLEWLVDEFKAQRHL